jgi:tetrahydromethanopterin S-methyltransferase subunit A
MATIPTISSIDSAIVTVREDLNRVRQIKKCTSCECLLDVLEALRADLADVASTEAEAARTDFHAWWEAGNVKRHRCPGCEPCLPIAPYNQLNAALADMGVATTATGGCAGGSCTCGSGTCSTPSESAYEETEDEGVTTAADEPSQTWPIVAGNYVVGDPAAPVAICTLADDDLMGELVAAGMTARVAITGTLATENLGVEHALRNLAANPHIRTLILCGRDSRGHHAGQALLSLKQSGIDAQRRIVGARGARAVLKNLTDGEIEAFRGRITVVDAIGTQDVSRITSLVTALLVRDTSQDGSGSPVLVPSDLSPRRPAPKLIAAREQERREWVHDPEGFFVILVDREAGAIVCEHYAKDGVHDETIQGLHAADVANTAVRRGLLSRLDHAAYLGRELAKAESALSLNLPYTQDEPLGAR